MQATHPATVSTASWRAEFSLADTMLMRFWLGGQLLVELAPAQINQQSEAQSLPRKSRIHRKIDGLSLVYRAAALIPFGPEPEIRREFDFTDGFARIIQDIDPGRAAAAEKLTVDRMSLPGPWRRLAVIRIPEPGKSFPQPEWFDLTAAADRVCFDESRPFLAVILETPDGKWLEIGTGDDLWRWSIAGGLPGCSAQFSVHTAGRAVELIRTPVWFTAIAEETPAVQPRAWRFKWYFAWTETSVAPAVTGRKQLILDLADYAEKNDGSPCLHGGPLRKQLRHALRSLIANHENTDLVLTGAKPHICAQESHLNRSTGKNSLHWDGWDFMELFLWANRQGLATGCTFRIDSKLDTPLWRRLARPGFQRICGE
ncbi:MAG: hypothetical protein PHH77_09580 [Victivallaceae bacterium]|nr:hypothetical protein [Victivallaceae bacterium]